MVMNTKLSMARDRVNKIKVQLENKRRDVTQAELDLQKALESGGSKSSSVKVVSLQAEVQALERSLSEAMGELEKAQEFENSEKAEALRDRMSKLEVDHKKLYKSLVSKVDPAIKVIDDLMEKLVEYDKIHRELGALPNSILGYISLKRKAPYSGMISLRADLERFLKFNEKFN